MSTFKQFIFTLLLLSAMSGFYLSTHVLFCVLMVGMLITPFCTSTVRIHCVIAVLVITGMALIMQWLLDNFILFRLLPSFIWLLTYGIKFYILCLVANELKLMIFVLMRLFLGTNNLPSHVIDFVSNFLERSKRPIYKASTARSEFRSMFINLGQTMTPGHPHAISAGIRGAADSAINNFLRLFGGRFASVSMSANDARRGILGSRPFLMFKDFADQQRDIAVLKSADMLKMIDVDYYLNPHEIVGDVPVIMYTLQPTAVARIGEDYSYRYVNDLDVETKVAGTNGGYLHQVWDYSVDCVSRFDLLTLTHYTMKIESHRLPNDRCIVLLTPVSKFCGYSALIAYLWAGESRLKRIRAVQSANLLSMPFVDDGISLMSMKFRDDSFDSVVVKTEALSVAKFAFDETTDLSSFQRIALANQPPEKYAKNPTIVAAILKQYVADSVPSFPTRVIQKLYTPPDYTPVYSDLPFENGKKTGRVWIEPYLEGAWLPMKSLASDIACVYGRVIAPRKTQVTMTSQLATFIQEFVSLAIPENCCIPKTVEESNENMKRPSQVSLYQRAKNSLFMTWAKISSFQKAEAYTCLNVPRNISTFDTTTKILYSGYMQSFTEMVLKNCSWYAFAHSPYALSWKVHDFCSRFQKVFCTDFSKFDGTINYVFRQLERAALIRAFPRCYTDDVLSLHASQMDIDAVTKFGIHYDVEDSRGSGSPETAAFNSFDNAFVSFVALRLEGHSPHDAYQLLGLYGGDDGINTGDVESYMKAVGMLGLDAKVNPIQAGNPLTFLGRIFVDPFVGPHSIIDWKRCVGKLHLTCNTEQNDKVVARRKALSIAYTDPETPFLATWARKVLSLTNDLGRKSNKRVNIFDREDVSWWYYQEQFQKTGKTFIAPPRETALEVIIGQFELGFLNVAKIEAAEARLGEAEVFEQLALPLVFGRINPEVKLPVLHNGEIIGNPQPAPVINRNGKMTVPNRPGMCHFDGCKLKSRGKGKYCAPHANLLRCGHLNNGVKCPAMKLSPEYDMCCRCRKAQTTA
jgi:hypothetical protein